MADIDPRLLDENGNLKEGVLSRFVDKLTNWIWSNLKSQKIQQLRQQNPELEREINKIENAKENIDDIVRDMEDNRKASF